MASSTRTSFLKIPRHVTWLIIVLEVLLLSSLVFTKITRPKTHRRPRHEASQRTEKLKDYTILSSPEECARQCDESYTYKTCYYKFNVEVYPVLGGACELCSPGNTSSISSDCQCVLADGVEKTFLSANRMLPGPSIQVCKGDKVVIDVLNLIQGMEVTIHWHGVYQNGSQYYDGVPFITQCPIAEGNTFRYQWMADNAGTHFWHAHTGLQKMDGLYGSIIVRESPSEDPNSNLYNHDLPAHVLLISDWMHKLTTERFPGLLTKYKGQIPDSALINGKGRFKNLTTGIATKTPLEVFTIEKGQRYRFRLINAFCSVCPAHLSIQGHHMTLIASDGEPIRPTRVDTIISFPGERYDFIVNANRPPGDYWIQLRGLGECYELEVEQLAILRYKGKHSRFASKAPTYNSPLREGVVLDPSADKCDTIRPNFVCPSQLKYAGETDKELITKTPDVKIYLPFRFLNITPDELYRRNSYNHFLVPPRGGEIRSLIQNISFKFPSSPPLSQPHDVSPDEYCNKETIPADCGDKCICTHKIKIPLHSIVEVFLVDEVGFPNLSHPFHLHGYTFKVLGMGGSQDKKVKKINVNYVRDLDRRGKISRWYDRPPSKDTLVVPDNGYVIFRFRADNPGYWLMHCHFLYHIVIGMDVLLHVGEQSDLPPVPKDFPVCGDYLPQITPLIY